MESSTATANEDGVASGSASAHVVAVFCADLAVAHPRVLAALARKVVRLAADGLAGTDESASGHVVAILRADLPVSHSWVRTTLAL